MEPRELTYGEHFGFTHGWWLDTGVWGLGVSVTHQRSGPLWPRRTDLVLEVGPFQWYISREVAA